MLSKCLLLTVKKIIQETPDTITLVFDVPAYSLKYKAGQYLTLTVSVGSDLLRRSYSLCTSPYTDAFPAITIKRVRYGKVSNYLNDHISVGDELEVLPPTGNFVLPPGMDQAQKLVFIGGGSGITPLFSMIKAALHQAPQLHVLLINANRDEAHIIYKRALEELLVTYKPRMHVVHVLSQPSATWQGLRGRLTSSTLEGLLAETTCLTDTHYFLCGPKEFMTMVSSTILASGVAQKYLHQEHFTLPTTPSVAGTSSSKLVVYYEGEKHVCKVAPHQTLLEAALDKGVDIPFACNSGMCNVCRAKCITGKVRMLEDEGLTQQELDQGYILTCVGYPTTDEVVIEVE